MRSMQGPIAPFSIFPNSAVLVLVSVLAATPAAAQPLATYALGRGVATFGLALPQGSATGSVRVGNLETQTDVKTTWSDGSIRFAVVSAVVPTSGNYPLTAGAEATGSFVPRLPAATVTITVNGTSYISTLPDRSSDTWLSGPIVQESRAVTTFVPSPPAPAKHLRVIWDVRSYAAGGHVVDVTLDNTKNDVEANIAVYSVAVSINGNVEFSRNAVVAPAAHTLSTRNAGVDVVSQAHGLVPGDYIRLPTQSNFMSRVHEVVDANTFRLKWPIGWAPANIPWERVSFAHPYMARWRKRFIVAPMTQASVTPDFAPLVASKILPEYMSSIRADTPTLAGWRYDLLGLGDTLYPMTAPGDRPEIALFPAWVARYSVFNTLALREHTLRQGDLSGTWSIHLSEADGSFFDINQHPQFFMGYQGPGDGPAGGGPKLMGRIYEGENGAAHQPSLALIPYLLTGDRYYLDELKQWANYGVLSWLWARNGADGLATSQQIRGLAWAVRDLAHATAFTPDADPHKVYFRRLLENNLSDIDLKVAQERDPLGSVSFWADGLLPGAGEIAPFMQSYVVWVMKHVADLGFNTTGQSIYQKIVRYFNNLANSPDFDFRDVGSYRIKVTDAGGNYFSSYGALWAGNFGPNGFYPVPNPRIEQGPSQGTYGPNLWILFLAARDLGLPNAERNLDRLIARTPGGYMLQDELNYRPHFAVVRTTGAGRSPAQRPAAPVGVRVVGQ